MDTPTHLNNLRTAMTGYKAAATFACGGKLPYDDSSSKDLFLYYEDKNGQIYRMQFPPSTENLEELTHSCDPATFGVGRTETLDTEYRSAWKLDKSRFLTSFHLSDNDIMETCRDFLCPTYFGLHPPPSIVAELYKLNVSPGPLWCYLTIDL